jgi:hypothetical protein
MTHRTFVRQSIVCREKQHLVTSTSLGWQTSPFCLSNFLQWSRAHLHLSLKLSEFRKKKCKSNSNAPVCLVLPYAIFLPLTKYNWSVVSISIYYFSLNLHTKSTEDPQQSQLFPAWHCTLDISAPLIRMVPEPSIMPSWCWRRWHTRPNWWEAKATQPKF